LLAWDRRPTCPSPHRRGGRRGPIAPRALSPASRPPGDRTAARGLQGIRCPRGSESPRGRAYGNRSQAGD